MRRASLTRRRARRANRSRFSVFVIEGEVEVAGDALSQGDSSAIAGVEAIEVRCTGSVPAKLLVFDVPLE